VRFIITGAAARALVSAMQVVVFELINPTTIRLQRDTPSLIKKNIF